MLVRYKRLIPANRDGSLALPLFMRTTHMHEEMIFFSFTHRVTLMRNVRIRSLHSLHVHRVRSEAVHLDASTCVRCKRRSKNIFINSYVSPFCRVGGIYQRSECACARARPIVVIVEIVKSHPLPIRFRFVALSQRPIILPENIYLFIYFEFIFLIVVGVVVLRRNIFRCCGCLLLLADLCGTSEQRMSKYSC